MPTIRFEPQRRRPAPPAEVSVNGRTIPPGEIGRELQHHPAARRAEAWQAAARALVVRELLLQEAERLGLSAEPAVDAQGRRETDEEARIRALVDDRVVPEAVDEAACRAWYERNRERCRSPDLVEVRHILLAAVPDDGAARAETRARATRLAAELRRRPDAFAARAAALSACPSRDAGGHLGWIGPGQTVPELERALPDLPVGEVAPAPIETRYGFHVVRVERRIEGRPLPFELVRNRIAAALEARARRRAIRSLIAGLAARATIRGVALDPAGPPSA